MTDNENKPAAALKPFEQDAEYKAFIAAHRSLSLINMRGEPSEEMILWHGNRHWNGKPGEMWRARAALEFRSKASAVPEAPEMDSLADLTYAQQTPEDWDADYRATWQKLQVAERNKAQWRSYALKLHSILTGTDAAPSAPQAEE